MRSTKVRDLMIPLSDYPKVHKNVTFYEAVKTLELAQKNLKGNQYPYRAVLVYDDDGSIIGKIGHRSFLKALEPNRHIYDEVEKLSRQDLSSTYIDSMMHHMEMWEDNIMDFCHIAQSVKAEDMMQNPNESISADDTIAQAIHIIVMWNSLSILVKEKGKIIGLVRITDLYKEVADYILSECKANQEGGAR
ncbi:MAG: HPP family protein [Candidatus Kapaibacterium sp.]